MMEQMETHIKIIRGKNDGWGFGVNYSDKCLSMDFYRWFIIFVWHKE